MPFVNEGNVTVTWNINDGDPVIQVLPAYTAHEALRAIMQVFQPGESIVITPA